MVDDHDAFTDFEQLRTLHKTRSVGVCHDEQTLLFRQTQRFFGADNLVIIAFLCLFENFLQAFIDLVDDQIRLLFA